MTEEQRKRVSEAQKKRMSNPLERERFLKVRVTNAWLGKKHSEETKRKISETLKGTIPWISGKHHAPEALKKMGLAHKGQHTKGEFKKGQIPWIKGKHQSKEAKQKMSIAKIGTTPWNKGKQDVYTPEQLRRISEATRKQMSSPEARELNRQRTLKLFESGHFPTKMNTKPERQIKEELIKRGYKEGTDFIHQYKFMNKFMCDFCFPRQKIIIEVDGDFWHANPNKYPIGSKLHAHQIRDRGRDKSKNAYITKVDNGSWTLLRFWESDIKKDIAKCVDRIEEVLKKKK